MSFLKKSAILVTLYRRQSTNNLITNRSIEIDHSRIWLCRKTSICKLGNKRYIKEVISVVPLDKIGKPKRVYPIITSPKILIILVLSYIYPCIFIINIDRQRTPKTLKVKFVYELTICIYQDHHIWLKIEAQSTKFET